MGRTTSKTAPKAAKPSVAEINQQREGRLTHAFSCPLQGCNVTATISKLEPIRPDGTTDAQQSADDALVCIQSVATHLREAHGAMLPGERAAAVVAPGGGGAGS